MVANKMSSGLSPRWWMEKLVAMCVDEGRFDGPAFATPNGLLAVLPDYDTVFRKYLKIVREETDLIPGDHDVDQFYSTFPMPQKISAT
jgi:hypothetical protein